MGVSARNREDSVGSPSGGPDKHKYIKYNHPELAGAKALGPRLSQLRASVCME